MDFLSDTTFQDNDIALNEIQQLSAEKLLGNPTGSSANVSQIGLGTGLEFDGTTLKVNSSVPLPTGTCQFLGVIPPATDITIFLDNVTNSRLNTPTGVLRVLHCKYKLFDDSTNELLVDTYEMSKTFKIYRDGSVNKTNFFGGGGLENNNFFWDDNLLSFLPQLMFDESTGDLDIYIDYTAGLNDYAYDVRLVVDVEYFDYPI